MTDYLRKRFPLADTSTVYMDGTSVFHLVSHDHPGIIAAVVMRPDQAETYRESIGRAMAQAWDEGFKVGDRYGSDVTETHAGYRDSLPARPENPYLTEGDPL